MEGKTTLCFLTVLLLLGNCVDAETCTEHRANKGAACINEGCWKDCARDYHGHYVKNAYCTGVYPFTKVYCVCDVCDE
ncbi:hypothetical protein ACQJBY_025528 [Aegilops geniculata]